MSPHEGLGVNHKPHFVLVSELLPTIYICLRGGLWIEPRLWVHLKPLVVRKPKTHVYHESDSILFDKQPNKTKAKVKFNAATVTSHVKKSEERGQSCGLLDNDIL